MFRYVKPWAVLLALACGSLGLAAQDATPRALDQSSTGPNGGNGGVSSIYLGSSADGTRVVFVTNEQLVSGDTDAAPDIYERAGGTTSLVSTGPNGGNRGDEPIFQGVSADGKHVFFESTEPLVSSDTDGLCYFQQGQQVPCLDVYDRSNGTTTLISASPGAPGDFNARFRGASDDGSHVFFTTNEQLTASDTDSTQDVYESSNGATTLVSTGPSGGNGAFDAYYKGKSRDGTHAFFVTAEQLTGADTDTSADVYDRSGGTTTLVSTGSSGGNGAFDAAFRGASASGSKVLFTTSEQLTGADTDSSIDLYARSAGTTSLVSTGSTGGNGAEEASYAGNSDDGSHVFFETSERMDAGDTDSTQDVYDRSGGATTLVSTGPAGGNGAQPAAFLGASADGGHVFIGTNERLTSADTDSSYDIYDRSAGTTTLVSTGPAGGNGAFDAYLDGISRDGSHVVFESWEKLVAEDTDAYPDVYERSNGTMTLISTGPGDGATYSTYQGLSDNGTRIFFVTGDALVSSDTDTKSDVYSSTDAVNYARPKAASPVAVALVLAYQQCNSPNSTHGPPPLSTSPVDPSCTPPAQTSGWLTVGTGDSNSRPTKSIGRLRIETINGNPSNPADEADVKLDLDITDVRRKRDLTDYAGEVQATFLVRITDKLNGSAPVDAASVTDVPFSFTAGCTPTSDTLIGSECSMVTTADSLAPGMIVEGRRAIWQLGQIEVFDGGGDGDVDTSPNTVFEHQGIFIP